MEHDLSNQPVFKGTKRHFWRTLLICALVGLTSLVANVRCLRNDFTNWDDPMYVRGNKLIRDLSWHGIANVFTKTHVSEYYPLNHLSYALDYHHWQLNPFGYHLSNLILHAVNSVLVFVFLSLLLRNCFASALAALLFAVHPVQVESVAWISERKTLLSTLFFLLSLLSCQYSEASGRKKRAVLYVTSLLLFVLAVLSKASIVILGLLLFVQLVGLKHRPIAGSVRYVLPFIIIGLAGSFAKFWVQYGVNTVIEHHGGPADLTTFIQMISVFTRYIVILLFPMHFSAFESNPVGEGAFGPWLPPSLLVLAIYAYLLWTTWKRNRTTFFCLVWFPICLLPVSHVVPFPVLMSGRYLYVPCIGLFAAAATLLDRSIKESKSRYSLRAALLAIALLLLCFTATNWKWTAYWNNSLALWTQSVAVSPDSHTPRSNLGATYDDLHYDQKAKAQLLLATSMVSYDVVALSRLGGIYFREGKYRKAEDTLVSALRLNSNYWLALYYRGRTLRAVGLRQDALEEMRKAVLYSPQAHMPRYYLGMWSFEDAEFEDAFEHLQRFLQLRPYGVEAERARELLINVSRKLRKGP